MAHGTPDYGVTAGAVTTYQLTDLGELAARLGSPITHDRRGDVIWWDDFECSLNKWATATGGTGASVALSTARARNGRTSCLLTAGSDGARLAQITHESPMPALTNVGLEVSWNLVAIIEGIQWRLNVVHPTLGGIFEVLADDVNDRLQFRNSANVFETFATGILLRPSATLFHTAKLVVDVQNRRYRRFIFNDTAYDLSAELGVTVLGGPPNYVELRTLLTGRAANNDTVYVDDFILTQNEPA